MQFDPTISVYTIIQIIGPIVTGLVLLVGFHWRLKSVEGNQKSMEAKLDAVGKALETLARQDERLNSHDRQLDDLRHGRGFVFEQPMVGRFPNRD